MQVIGHGLDLLFSYLNDTLVDGMVFIKKHPRDLFISLTNNGIAINATICRFFTSLILFLSHTNSAYIIRLLPQK